MGMVALVLGVAGTLGVFVIGDGYFWLMVLGV